MRGAALSVALLLILGYTTQNQRGAPVDQAEVADRAIELGTAYLRQGDYGRAKDNLMKALAIDNQSASAHHTLAIVFQQEREFELAESYFKRAIALDPAMIAARNNYGAFLYAQDRPQDAVEQLTIATEDRFYELRPQAFENLAVSYLALKNQPAAREAFERAEALNPRLPRTLLELTLLYLAEQNYTTAKALYLRHRAIAAESARSLYACAKIYAIFLDDAERRRCTADLIRIYPTSIEASEVAAVTQGGVNER